MTENLISDPVIVLHKVCKSFADKMVVDRVSFAVGRGTGFGLLGPNSAGKSTILKMVYGMVRPSSGQILIEGMDVARQSSQARRGLGIVPQDDCHDPDLNVYDNLRFHARYCQLPLKSAAHSIGNLVEGLGLAEKASENVSSLSGGMRRRLALARALLTDPPALILDEPTRSLDEESRCFLLERLLELKARGATLLLATHDREEAEILCDRVADLEQGCILSIRAANRNVRELPGRQMLMVASRSA